MALIALSVVTLQVLSINNPSIAVKWSGGVKTARISLNDLRSKMRRVCLRDPILIWAIVHQSESTPGGFCL